MSDESGGNASGPRCPACGARLLTFRQHLLLMRLEMTCPNCGARLRMRHLRKIVLGTVALGLACAFVVDYVTDGAAAWIGGMAILLVLAIGAEYLFWKSAAAWELKS